MPIKWKQKPPREPRIPLAIPRPSEVKKAPTIERVFADGRTKINQLTKEGRDLYQHRKRVAWEAQGRLCSICHKPLTWADSTVDHVNPRGMGGGKIDDRQENIAAAHALCNSQKGGKRITKENIDPFESF